MPDIQFTCSCGKTYKISSTAIGKQVRCPNCKKVLLLQGGQNQAPSNSTIPIGKHGQRSSNTNSLAKQLPPVPVHSPSPFDTPVANTPGSLYGDYPSYSPPRPKRNSQSGIPILPIIFAVAGIGSLFIVGVVIYAISRLEDPFKNFALSDNLVASPTKSEGPKQPTSRENQPLSNYAPAPPKVPAEPLAAPPGNNPMDDATMVSLGERFAAAMQQNNQAGLHEVFDEDELFRRAIDVGFKVDSRIEQGTKDGMRNVSRSRGGMFADMARQIQNGGSAKFIRLKQIGPNRCAIVRLIFATRGVNYLGMIAEPSSTRVPKFCDMYSLMADDMISDTMKRVYIGQLESRGSILDKLTGRERASIQRHKAIDRLLKLHDKPAEFVSTFEAMDSDLKSDKMMCMLYLRASMQINDAAYQRAMEHYHRVVPPGISSEMLLLDLYMHKEQYNRALAALDHMDASIGGDAYVDVMRSGVYRLMGNNVKAVEFMEAAIAKEPAMSSFYVSE